MRLPASTQAVPDTCGAAGAISSPAEPLCTQKSPGKTSVTTPGSEHALCLHFCLTPGIRLGALTSRVPGRDHISLIFLSVIPNILIIPTQKQLMFTKLP